VVFTLVLIADFTGRGTVNIDLGAVGTDHWPWHTWSGGLKRYWPSGPVPTVLKPAWSLLTGLPIAADWVGRSVAMWYNVIGLWCIVNTQSASRQLAVFDRLRSKKSRIFFQKFKFCSPSTYKYPHGLSSFHTHINPFSFSSHKVCLLQTQHPMVEVKI
jgi:hypothetical protein